MKKEQIETWANRFKLLGDPTRLGIMMRLLFRDLDVGSLVQLLKRPQSTVSHHLGLLRLAGLVTTRQGGRHVYYSLADRQGMTQLLHTCLVWAKAT